MDFEKINTYLTTEQKEYLDSNKTYVDYKKGETIIKQGVPANHVVYLEKGFARLNITDQDHTSCIDLVFTGSFIGLMCSFTGNNFIFSAEAIDNCRISIVNKDVIYSLLKENSEFSLAVINYISRTTAGLVFWMSRLRYKHIEGALAMILLKFNSHYDNLSFELPVTRKELAEILGYSKESVINTLSKFKNDNLINIHNRSVVEIVDMKTLKIISEKG